VPADQHFVDGVVGKPTGVVGVGIAAGNGEDALTKQLVQIVDDLPGLPLVAQASSQTFNQTEPPVSGLQEDSTTIRAGVGLVELGDERFFEEVGEQDSLLRGRVHQAKASGVGKAALASAFYHEEAFVFSDFVNFPG
jgi:hypothetical protein